MEILHYSRKLILVMSICDIIFLGLTALSIMADDGIFPIVLFGGFAAVVSVCIPYMLLWKATVTIDSLTIHTPGFGEKRIRFADLTAAKVFMGEGLLWIDGYVDKKKVFSLDSGVVGIEYLYERLAHFGILEAASYITRSQKKQ